MREKSEARFNSSEHEQARDKVSILKTRQEYLMVTSWLPHGYLMVKNKVY